MIDYSFPLEELEYYLLILVRVSCFIFAAPFFSMNNTPVRIRIGLSCFVAYVVYIAVSPHVYPQYDTLFQYAAIIIEEATIGLLIALGAQFCMMIVTFAGHFFAQRVQPLQFSAIIEYVRRSAHSFAGHLLSFI